MMPPEQEVPSAPEAEKSADGPSALAAAAASAAALARPGSAFSAPGGPAPAPQRDARPRPLRLKFHYRKAIRVVVTQRAGVSFKALRQRLAQDYGFDVSLAYHDVDGDVITLATQNDFEELLATVPDVANVRVTPLLDAAHALSEGDAEATPDGAAREALGPAQYAAPPNRIKPPRTLDRIIGSPTPSASAAASLGPLMPVPLSPLPVAASQPPGEEAVASVPASPSGRRYQPLTLEGLSNKLEALSTKPQGKPLSPTAARAAAEGAAQPPHAGGDAHKRDTPTLDPLARGASSGAAFASFASHAGGNSRPGSPAVFGGVAGGSHGAVSATASTALSVAESSARLTARLDSTQGSCAPALAEAPWREAAPRREVPERRIRWQRGEMIGQGAFGRVYLALHLDTGELMAVKHLDTHAVSSRERAALENEVSMMRGLHHPNIVRYIGFDSTDTALAIFLEYVSGGSLRSLLDRFGKLEEALVCLYTRQILLGLEYLHGNGIAHRDIKAANVLVSNDGSVKLADFGASKRIFGHAPGGAAANAVATGGAKGTPLWMAPEVIKDVPKAQGWRKADVWSVGCTVIEMATGRPPWSQYSNPVTAMYHIACVEELPDMPQSLSEDGHQFLWLCFQREPKRRPESSSLLLQPFVAIAPTAWRDHAQHHEGYGQSKQRARSGSGSSARHNDSLYPSRPSTTSNADTYHSAANRRSASLRIVTDAAALSEHLLQAQQAQQPQPQADTRRTPMLSPNVHARRPAEADQCRRPADSASSPQPSAEPSPRQHRAELRPHPGPLVLGPPALRAALQPVAKRLPQAAEATAEARPRRTSFRDAGDDDDGRDDDAPDGRASDAGSAREAKPGPLHEALSSRPPQHKAGVARQVHARGGRGRVRRHSPAETGRQPLTGTAAPPTASREGLASAAAEARGRRRPSEVRPSEFRAESAAGAVYRQAKKREPGSPRSSPRPAPGKDPYDDGDDGKQSAHASAANLSAMGQQSSAEGNDAARDAARAAGRSKRAAQYGPRTIEPQPATPLGDDAAAKHRTPLPVAECGPRSARPFEFSAPPPQLARMEPRASFGAASLSSAGSFDASTGKPLRRGLPQQRLLSPGDTLRLTPQRSPAEPAAAEPLPHGRAAAADAKPSFTLLSTSQVGGRRRRSQSDSEQIRGDAVNAVDSDGDDSDSSRANSAPQPQQTGRSSSGDEYDAPVSPFESPARRATRDDESVVDHTSEVEDDASDHGHRRDDAPMRRRPSHDEDDVYDDETDGFAPPSPARVVMMEELRRSRDTIPDPALEAEDYEDETDDDVSRELLKGHHNLHRAHRRALDDDYDDDDEYDDDDVLRDVERQRRDRANTCSTGSAASNYGPRGDGTREGDATRGGDPPAAPSALEVLFQHKGAVVALAASAALLASASSDGTVELISIAEDDDAVGGASRTRGSVGSLVHARLGSKFAAPVKVGAAPVKVGARSVLASTVPRASPKGDDGDARPRRASSTVTAAVTAVAVTAASDRVLTGADDCCGRIWSAETRQLLHVLEGHDGRITCVRMIGDGDGRASSAPERAASAPSKASQWTGCVMTASADHTVRLWDVRMRRAQALALRGHSDTVNDVVLDAENLTAFSASRDTSVRVWDLRCGRCRFNLTQHFGSVQCLASDSTLDHGRGGFISGARDTTVHVWARQSGALVQALRSQRGFIAALQLLPRNFAGAPPLLAAASTNGKIRLWDHHSGKLVRNYAGLQQAATCLAYVAAAPRCDSAAAPQSAGPQSAGGGKHSMVHGPDAGWLFAGGADCAVRVWDARTAHATATIDGHLGAITGLHAHPLHGGSRSARIFSASRDGSVRVCDI